MTGRWRPPVTLRGQPSVRPQVVVLNLSEVPFIDSTALAVFVWVFKRLRHEGAELVLWAPPAKRRRHALATASSLLRRLFFVRSSSNR
jgi:anti-anti-sigma factor